jgi:hypothetical protein
MIPLLSPCFFFSSIASLLALIKATSIPEKKAIISQAITIQIRVFVLIHTCTKIVGKIGNSIFLTLQESLHNSLFRLLAGLAQLVVDDDFVEMMLKRDLVEALFTLARRLSTVSVPLISSRRRSSSTDGGSIKRASVEWGYCSRI